MEPLKIKIHVQTLLPALLIATLQSCYYDNKPDLLGNSGLCDTLHVTFSQTISPLLNTTCNSCHGGAAPQGGISLEGHGNVSMNAEASLAAIQAGRMPKGGSKLDDCTILKFKSWIDKGSPNN